MIQPPGAAPAVPAPSRPGRDGQPETEVGDLCEELGITRQTLYLFVSPMSDLRDDGKNLPERRKAARA